MRVVICSSVNRESSSTSVDKAEVVRVVNGLVVTASQCSHRHQSKTMRDLHKVQNPVQQAKMGGSDQFPSGTPDHHRWCRKGKRVEIWRCPHPNPFLELMTSKVSFPKLQERHMEGVAQEIGVVEDWDNPSTNQEFCQNRGW